MAKKRRSKAQKAATRKMIAANRRRRSGTKTTRRAARRSRKQVAAAKRNLKHARSAKRRKKTCRRAAGRRGAAKRHRRPMPAMPKACGPRKRKKGKRKASKTHRKTTHTSHRKSAKRVAAGKKAARTRARHKAERRASRKKGGGGHKRKKTASLVHHHAIGSYDPYRGLSENPVRRRRRRRGGRRHNPVHHRRHHAHRHPFMRRNPLANPLGSIAEVFSGILGVGTGYVFADAIDRFLATHPLTPNVAGNGYTDTPPAGQLWDSEAPALPLWSSWQRMLAATVIVFTPGMASRFVRGAKGKAFLQRASYGAGAKVGGKLLTDGLALVAGKMANSVGPVQTNLLRLYGPEVAVSARLSEVQSNPAPLTASAAGTSPTQPAGMLAGPPQGLPSQGVGRGVDPDACGPGPCSPIQPAGVITDVLEAQGQVFAAGQPNYGPEFLNYGPFNPQDPFNEGASGDCAPLPMQNLQYNGLPGGTQVTSQSPIPPAPAPCPPGMIQMPDGSCMPPPVQASTQLPPAAPAAPAAPPPAAPPAPPPAAPPPAAPQPYLPR